MQPSSYQIRLPQFEGPFDLLLFFIEMSRLSLGINKMSIHPALIFILSFLLVIVIGTLLLKLPNATVGGISWIDALFTATSAVCVTGLIVVDTATVFTGMGKTILMVLIQMSLSPTPIQSANPRCQRRNAYSSLTGTVSLERISKLIPGQKFLFVFLTM